MVSYTGLRGAYDFLCNLQKDLLSKVPVLKWQQKQVATLCNITICEAININDVAVNAAKIAAAYKGPGQ